MRIFQSGAETGVKEEWGYGQAVSPELMSLSPTTTSKTGYGSDYSWVLNKSSGTGFVQDFVYFNMGTSSEQVYAKMDIRVQNLTESTTTKSLIFYPIIFSNGGADDCVGIYLKDGLIHVVTTIGSADVIVDDYTTTLGENDWFRLEAYFDATPGDGSEILTVKLDGETIINNTTANFADKKSRYNFMRLYSSSNSWTTHAVVYIDNVAWNDTSGQTNNSWVGEEYIMALRPNGSGDSNATSGDYTSINEIPYNKDKGSSEYRLELADSTTEAWFTLEDSGLESQYEIKAINIPIYI